MILSRIQNFQKSGRRVSLRSNTLKMSGINLTDSKTYQFVNFVQ